MHTGTLTKMCLFEPDVKPWRKDSAMARLISYATVFGKFVERDMQMELKSSELGGTFHFLKFQSSAIEDLVDKLQVC